MTPTATAITRYREALAAIPPPGGGCHPTLLRVSNLGVLAGVTPDQIFSDIRQAVPPGARRIPDREIETAIQKALTDHTGGTYTPRPRPAPLVQDGAAALRAIISQGRIDNEADLWGLSPVRLLGAPQDDPALLLEALYKPGDLLFVGDRTDPGILGDTIRPAADWITHFRNNGPTSPHVILNPLTGSPAPKKTGDGDTLRGDANVADFRYVVIEFDGLDRESQIRFWSAAKLPVVALIDSGNRSVHAWVDVQKLAVVTSADQWSTEIRQRLYDRILTPMGADPACANPARLSRLPGHFRAEKKSYQRLLWLSPEGRPIQC